MFQSIGVVRFVKLFIIFAITYISLSLGLGCPQADKFKVGLIVSVLTSLLDTVFPSITVENKKN